MGMPEDKIRTLIAFGTGVNFYSLMERLDHICDIAAFCDNDSRKWGQYLLGDERICISPRLLGGLDHPFVLILAERESSIRAIERQCDGYGVPHQRIHDFLESRKVKAVTCHWPQLIQRRRIHKFIELLIHGTTECNFHCEYCYVWRKRGFAEGRSTSKYSPEEIREALSQKKLGGPCHINACALGETLLSKDIVELCYKLLDEGHYMSVITNGTITPKIDAILQFPPQLLERMFFKLSFHYSELKRTGLLGIFWENAEKIKKSPCSYSLEITPCDSLIDEIPHIQKEFMDHAEGAMPHITFTRDGNKEGLDLLSDLSLEEYKNIWGQFDSGLFKMKCDLYKKKVDRVCYAGSWSYRVNAVNGNLQSCYQQELNGTIFDKGQKVLPILTVGRKCRLDYCFNNHAFLAWGDVPDIICSNYLEVRDRMGQDSSHWVKAPYAAAMQQKLYENNFQYVERWPDYEKLFAADREPAFILFNSPDYGNLGDHGIALAERRLFRRLFPNISFIEISCEQYVKENLLIRNVIQDKDVLIISGGGYLGSLWLWLEDLTKNIIQQYTRNKIIIFPQTMFFEDSSLGKAERHSLADVFHAHPDLTVMLRDSASYKLALELLDDSVKKMLMPDIALSLACPDNDVRKGGYVCIREDKEARGIDTAKIRESLRKMGLEADEINTVSQEEVCLGNRETYLENLMKKVSSAKVVVTDRLHMMIFCAVTHTPCIAFDNISGKLSGTYPWIQNDYPVILCECEERLDECLERVLGRDGKNGAVHGGLSGKFRELDKFLRGSCFV